MSGSLAAYALASGSSGNCILIRTSQNAVLIDAGISCRRVCQALLSVDQDPASIDAVFLTHEHSDHTKGALVFARKYGARLLSTAETLAELARGDDRGFRHQTISPGQSTCVGDLCIDSFPIPHDATNPVGYCLYSGKHKICCATDIGIPTATVREQTRGSDLLILESNHDVTMLLKGPYPVYLKRRIMGERGHLSNDVAAGLLAEADPNGRGATAWLAHLSQTNNHPDLALKCSQKKLADIGCGNLRVDVALRDNPSVCWTAANTSFQLSMTF